jgi:transposase
VQRWTFDIPQGKTVLSETFPAGLDLANSVLQVRRADGPRRPALRKRLWRDWMLAFFSGLQPCVVAMEACDGEHLWSREIPKLDQDVRPMPPAEVTPFFKRQKNDAT